MRLRFVTLLLDGPGPNALELAIETAESADAHGESGQFGDLKRLNEHRGVRQRKFI